MACVFSRYNAHSDWLALGYHSPVMPMGRLQACKLKQRKKIYNKQVINLEPVRS